MIKAKIRLETICKIFFCRPQLADRVPVAKLEKLFGGREFFIETKYDGERCQVHLLKG